MRLRLYVAERYDVQYSDSPLGEYELSNDIIDMIRHSATGFVSEDELEMEIDKEELKEIKDNDEYPNLKETIERILQESDPKLNYVHLSIF